MYGMSKNLEKYNILNICPIVIYGYSTGQQPIHLSISHEISNMHIIIFIGGINLDVSLFIFSIGNIYRIMIAERRPITPPSLLGIDRRIAYSHRKYHSGWMCIGVVIGFASIKFSGSLIRFGKSIDINNSMKINIINPIISFIVK